MRALRLRVGPSPVSVIALTGVDLNHKQAQMCNQVRASIVSLFHGYGMSANCMADELRQPQVIEIAMDLIENLVEGSKRTSRSRGRGAWELG